MNIDAHYESMYDLLGGEDGIRKLVQIFYPIVQQNSLLAPLFPEDLTAVMEKQFLFLTQFFGGAPLYSEQYGHPMMRARHMKFAITTQHAEAWLSCMKEALAKIGLDQQVQELVWERLKGPAYHFVNQGE